MNTKSDYEAEESLTPKDILTQIWFSPKKVFTYIVNYKYDKYVTLLLILSGIAKALDKALTKNVGDFLPFWQIILFVLLIGISFGWLINFLLAAAIHWTGKWLNGQADTKSILRVIAYAMIPSLFSVVLLIIQMPIYGSLLFKSTFFYFLAESYHYKIYYSYLAIDILLIIWSTVLLTIGLVVVQKFSIGKAVLNLIITAVFVTVTSLALYLFIDLFRPLT